MSRPKKETQTPDEIAQRLLRDMQSRFTELNIATGRFVEDDDGQMHLFLGVKGKMRRSCEATFPVGIAYERIRNSFSAWAETHARKLGVKKIYANVKSDDDDDMDEAA